MTICKLTTGTNKALEMCLRHDVLGLLAFRPTA